MELIVPDDKLSLAIGKKGQNVRLASQLTGWRIDIHSESKVREMEARARASLAAIEGVSAEMAETLFRAGFRSASDVANAKVEELASLLGGTEVAQRILPAAARAAEVERVRHAEEAARAREEMPQQAGAEGAPAGGSASSNPEAP
jgi:N utilization substance protein A